MMIRRLAKKVIDTAHTRGIRATVHLIKNKLGLSAINKKQLGDVFPDEDVLRAQSETQFEKRILFSIITPLYNTPETFLKEMIRSVQAQTYADWELCLCDASDEKHAYVGETCRNIAARDKRIRYHRLASNEGISGNTNECIKIASGSYFALLDHDDVLHPSALYEAAKAICDHGADFVYTDEAKFRSSVRNFFDPAYKPDFAKDDLRAHNYICHLTVYSRKLFEQVGPYDTTKDGSQDHDMVLRLTEKAHKIVHIPKILYFWRAHEGSVSTGIGAKSYATQAGLDAVAAQLKRQNEPGEVHTIPPYPSLYKVEYEIEKKPLISVVIYGNSSIEDLNRCIASLENMTDYYPIEMFVRQENRNTAELKKASIQFPTVKPFCVIWKNQQLSLNDTVRKCNGEVIFFVHATTQIIIKDWALELLMYAQREDVGAVGMKLLDGNLRMYSGGVTLNEGIDCPLHHMHRGVPEYDQGYEAALKHVRNVSILADTGLMISKRAFDLVGGFHEEMGPYQFADLCLRLRKQGLLNVWIPFTQAIYRGSDPLLSADSSYFSQTWNSDVNAIDPYFNPNVKKYEIF